MRSCTCYYGAGRACRGQATLGEGWYCADERNRAKRFAVELPDALQDAALLAIDKGATVEAGVLVLRAGGAIVRFWREP